MVMMVFFPQSRGVDTSGDYTAMTMEVFLRTYSCQHNPEKNEYF